MINTRLVLFLISAYLHITFQFSLVPENIDEGDGFGNSVSISGDFIVVGAPYDESNATTINGDSSNNDLTAAGAAYVFIKTADGWTQEAYLKPPNAGERDTFGWAVDIDKATIVIGAPWEDSNSTGINGDPFNDDAPDAGAAYVFVREEDGWRFDAYLKASNAEQLDNFGQSVSISANTIVVGAFHEDSNGTGEDTESDNSAPQSGAAYVFEREGGEWTQTAFLKAPSPGKEHQFGSSVSVSQNRIVVGAWLEDIDDVTDAGGAYVFVKNGDTWTHEANLTNDSPAENDRFGYAVSISGDIVAVGAPNKNDEDGEVYVYVRDTMWTLQKVLYHRVGQPGGYFGTSVSISGDAIIVGSWESSGGSGFNCSAENEVEFSGAVYAFEKTSWELIACMKSPDPQYLAGAGASVDVHDGTYVFGNSGTAMPGAFVYQSDTDVATTGMVTTGTSYEVIVFTAGETFEPRIVSLPDSSTYFLIESATEVCVECVNIRRPSEKHFIRSGTVISLPRGIYGCVITSCTKRSVEDSNSDPWSLIFSGSNRPSKDSSSKSSSKSSDSDSTSSDSSNGISFGDYDLLIFVGGDALDVDEMLIGDDAEDQMFIEEPSTEAPSTTQSTSNKDIIGVVVIGLGLLVMVVVLLSYWRKRNNTTTEQSHLLSLSHNNIYHD